MYFPHHQLILRWNDTAHSLTNGIRDKVMDSSHGSVIAREGLLEGPQFDSLPHHQLVLRWNDIAHSPTTSFRKCFGTIGACTW